MADMHTKLLLLIALWAGCADDPSPPPPPVIVDPTGHWAMTFSWTKGACGLTGLFDANLTVTRTLDGYRINETNPEVQVSGTVLCTTERCQMSFTESGPGPTGSAVQQIVMSANLAVDDQNAITGGGSVTYRFTDGTACDHQFRADGWRS
jgi:hypothetical protein